MNSQAITSEQMYKIEENGHRLFGMKRLLMMENAGHRTADFLLRRFDADLKRKKIVAVCGSGNNGGDTFVACRHLAAACITNITIILLTTPKEIRTSEAKINWNIIRKMKSLKKITIGSHQQSDSAHFIETEIEDADIILDGLLGTGVKGQIREPFSSAIDRINHSKAYVLAIDVPSGLDPTSGEPSNKCIEANATITFHRMKKGLDIGKKYTGSIHIEKIGIPPEAEDGVLI
ncbi:MAG: NAD(P)H-hydrate epimerase [Nitrososphaeraceae archaeon]|jgi:NAD(P)H-hydrate epimerase